MSGHDNNATAVDPQSSTYLPGTDLNPRFRVIRTLGRRGVLELIEVEDQLRRCRRAARLLPVEIAQDSTAVARLRREAEAGASVTHPGVLRVEGLERADDGGLFVVTELFEGAPLADRLTRGPLPIAVAVEIAQKVADALTALHRTQVVHRDLKPSGILLAGEDGALDVKLIDFGLVKVTGDWDATRLTQTVGLLGSPEYMSPEHVLHPHELDARADVYALGVVLYEMLVGAPPFTNVAFGPVLQMHLKQAPPDPRARRTDVPAQVAEAVLKALAKSPDRRFATARQMGAALGAPPSSRPPRESPKPKAPQPASRSLTLPIGAAAVSVVLVTAGVWRVTSRPRDIPAPSAATATAATDEVAMAATPTPPRHAAPAAALPKGALFGGRPIEWWSRQLNELHDQSTSAARARYSWFQERAAANGLTVEASAAAVTVIAPPHLVAVAHQRWVGREVDALDTASTAAALGDRTELLRLADEIAATLAQDRSYRTSPRHPQVILAPRHTVTSVVRIQFAAGSYHDAERPGLTRVAQLAMLVANERGSWGDLALEVDRAGGRVHVHTGLADSAITLEVASSEIDGLAQRLFRMVLTPSLDGHRLSVAKTRARLGSEDDDDLDALGTILAERAFDGPGFDNAPSGDADVINALDASEIRRHFAGPLSPANATVIVAGDFDEARIRAGLSAAAGGRAAAFERPTRDPAGTYRADAFANIRLVAYPVSFATPAEAAAAHLSAALIEERLFERFRREGVAYSASAAPYHQRWLDYVLVAVPFASHAPDNIGDQIDAEVSALAKEGLTSAAILRNQRAVLESLSETVRDPTLLAPALGAAGGVEWTGPAVAEALATLSPERLAAIARPWLDPRRSVQVELSPTATRKR